MITIKFLPVRSDAAQPQMSWFAPVITLDGQDYDLSELPDGATAQHPVLGSVSRNGDDYELTMTLPHGPNAPAQTRFPEPIVVTENGPIDLPPYDQPTQEVDDELVE